MTIYAPLALLGALILAALSSACISLGFSTTVTTLVMSPNLSINAAITVSGVDFSSSFLRLASSFLVSSSRMLSISLARAVLFL